MGNDNAPLLPCRGGVGEIGNILPDSAFPDAFQHILLLHKQISCEVQKNHALLHLTDGLFVDHAFGGVKKRDMNRDNIAALVNFLHIEHMLYITAQIPRRVHGNIRIVPVYFHSHMLCHIGHLHADGS